MKMKLFLIAIITAALSQEVTAQTNVTEIAFRNSDGGDDSDPYRMRKVQGSSNSNWLELQLNDDADESFRIYGNSCVGFGCATYSGNLYHSFTTNGNAFHSGNLGIGGNPSARIHVIDTAPTGVQALNGSTKFALDAAGGGFAEFRNTSDNNTYSGLLFTDNNLGGYVAFRNAPDDKLHLGAYGGIAFEVGTGNGLDKAERVRIDANGKVGIGTTSPDQLLTVNGTIHSKEVKVDLSVPAPDYVFGKEYKLPSLEEIKTYIDQNKHLPEVPSAKEMEANGVQLGEMNMLLLKKMEEMTLYMIELKSENAALKARVEKIEHK